MTTDLPDDVTYCARQAARRLVIKYGPYVEFDDMLQEGLLWLWQHPQRVERARDDEGRLYQGRVIGEIQTALIPKAKKIKAQALGVSTRYQSRYSYEAVEAVLPAYWDPTPTSTPGTPETAGRGTPDPAYGGNYQVALMDIRRAIDLTVSRDNKRLLFTVYGLGATGKAGQYFSHVPRAEIEQRTRRVVQSIVDFLNDEPPTVLDGPGTRKVVSNAQARASQEDGY